MGRHQHSKIAGIELERRQCSVKTYSDDHIYVYDSRDMASIQTK